MTQDEETSKEIAEIIAEEIDPDWEDKHLVIANRNKRQSDGRSSRSSSNKAPTTTSIALQNKKIPKKGEKGTATKEKGIIPNRGAGKNNQNNTNKTKQNTERKKGKEDREEGGKEEKEVWVSILAIPRQKGRTVEVQGLYRELAKYAIRAMTDRQRRKVNVSEAEQRLLQRWKRNEGALGLEERHGGELGWDIQEEGRKEKENNRILAGELSKARKEVVSLKDRVGKQVENSKIDMEVVRRVEEYKSEIRREKENELKMLRQENSKLLEELGGKKREIELMIEQMKKASSRRRGKKKKRGEDDDEEESRKMMRRVGAVGEVRKGKGLEIEASVVSNS